MSIKVYLATISMTAQDFAHKLDITGRYLSNIITGKSLPSRRLARDIEAATNGMVKVPFSLKTKKVREDEKRIAKEEQQKNRLEKQKAMQPDLFEKLEKISKREMSIHMDMARSQERPL